MQVPLLDLSRQYREIASDIEPALAEVVESQHFILGPRVEAFERQISEFLEMPHAIGCASGTDALLLSLRAVDAVAGTEVVTSPFTFFATAGAIHNAGATPVFADIRPDSFNLDPEAAEDAVGENTRAVVPVHLFGQMAEMESFREIADRRRVALIEDAAQAIGARRRLADGQWITTGTLSDACAFSFFPSKNLGAFGDGGMVVAHDDEVAARLRRLRVHGGRQMYHHEEVGYNSRLDSLQAAVLSVKLPRLPRWSEARRENAAFYDEALGDVEEICTPVVPRESESIFNQYTIRVLDGRRDALATFLKERGVGTSIYYPVPLHLQQCFEYLGYRQGQFPNSERAASEVLSLPIFPELTAAELEYVAESIRDFFAA